MRKIIRFHISLLCIILSMPVLSQSSEKQKPSIGAKTGLNISKLNLNGKSAGTTNSNYRTGFVVGAFVNIPVKKLPFSIQPEFLYSSMGGDLTNELNENQ